MVGAKTRKFSWLDGIRLTRVPNLIIVVIGQYFTTLFLIRPYESLKVVFFDWRLFLLSSSTVLIAAAGYIINDYYDVKIDLINKPSRVVVGKNLSRRLALTYHSILNGLGILAGLIVGVKLAVINFLSSFLLWLYSNHLKRMPLIGNLSIALLTGVTISLPLIIYPQKSQLVLTYAIFAFFLTLIREVIKDMEDLKGDATFGCKTLPVVWGIAKTKWFLFFTLGLFLASLVWMCIQIGNSTLNLYFLLLSPIGILFIYKLWMADTQRQFYLLSTACKLIMVSGIFSMVFFK